MIKMNNKGVITRGMALLAFIILFVIGIIFIYIGILKNKSVDNYKKFEDELVNAAQNYYEIKNIKVEEGEEKKITLSTLKKANLVYSDYANKCKGYVIISNERDFSSDEYKIVSTAYVKCGNKYMSANYSEY